MKTLSPRIAGSKILVVDDVESTRHFIQEVLKQRGFTDIEVAVDGREALEKTYLMKPDIVLLDLMMPTIDGFAYCEHIRKDASFTFMPILVQTASEDRQDKLRALSCGADDFLCKPLDQSELFLRVCLHLERHKILRDNEDVREYLVMELGRAQEILDRVKESALEPQAFALLGEHYAALEMISQPN